MMRSPYQSPKDPPAQRFLRLPPREKSSRKRRLLLWGAAIVLAFLAYSFVGSDTGLVRIRALEHETAELRKQKLELAALAKQAEAERTGSARDPLLAERIARERFHLVRKDETLYRYDAEESSK